MSSDLETLLARSGWIRGLAQQLARDGQTADDLVQDAWVVALRHGPADGASLRSWLAGVLRNLARQDRRRAGQRAARERRAARPEALPPPGLPDALVERLDEQEALAAAVRGLDEPYRAAILLRYYEGLSPSEIATRTGTPLRTVHTRLNRALHRLRAKLGTERDGRTWSILALPWIGALRGGVPGASTVPLGGWIVKTKLEIALACAALVGVATLGTWWVQQPSQPVPALAAAPGSAVELAPPTGTIERAHEALPERVALAPAAASAVEPAPSVAQRVAPGPLSGLVIDAEGGAVPGLRVVFNGFGQEHGLRADTDAQGRFTFDEPLPSGDLTVASEGWTTVLKPVLWSTDASEEPVIVVARELTLAGSVVDAGGAPIAGARIELVASDQLRASLGRVLEHSVLERWHANADELGRFELAHAPRLSGAWLVTSAAGYARDVRPPPSGSAFDLAIVLADGDEHLLRGTVVDGRGLPVAGARVGLGTSGARSDERGAFAIRLPDERFDRLWVVAQGLLPASVQRRGTTNAASDAWPAPLRIVLDGEPLAIAGRVVDADGRPLSGVRVWTDDLTDFGAIQSEDFGPDVTMAADVEVLAAGQTHELASTTDAEGRFELRGLLERDYRISAASRERLLLARTEPIAAGARDVLVRLPRGEELLRVAGRVVGLDGRPLADVAVIPERELVAPDGTRTRIEGEQDVRTDAEGRFEITGLAALPTRLDLRGEAVMMSTSWPIPDGARLDDLEVAVARRCRFQVALDEPQGASACSVLDADGVRLPLLVLEGNMAWHQDEIQLVLGRTQTLSVSEAARTLLVTGAQGKLRRIALELVPGELVTVR